MKTPSFQFYPADWLSDITVRSLTPEERGIWFDMICMMHEGQPYGHLAINGEPIEEKTLSKMLGISQNKLKKMLEKFEKKSLFSLEKSTEIIYSRRMVEDEKKREEWRQRQQKHRTDASRNSANVTHDVTPMSRRSSSPSSSSEELDLTTTATTTPSKPDEGSSRGSGQFFTIKRPGLECSEKDWLDTQLREWLRSEGKKVEGNVPFEHLDHFFSGVRTQKHRWLTLPIHKRMAYYAYTVMYGNASNELFYARALDGKTYEKLTPMVEFAEECVKKGDYEVTVHG